MAPVMPVKKKVGTVLDDALLQQAKLLADRDNIRLSQVIEEALRHHLQRKQGTGRVARSRGILRAPPGVVRAIMEEEEDFLDS